MKNGKKTSVGTTKGSVAKGDSATAAKPLPLPPHMRGKLVEKQGLGPVSAKSRDAGQAGATTVTPAAKTGLGPQIAKKSPPSVRDVPSRASVSDLKVKLLNGDDGAIYYQFVADGQHVILPAPEVIGSLPRVYAELTKIRVLASSASDKQEIKEKIDTPDTDTTVVATRYGYEDAPRPAYFVYGDGSVLRASTQTQIVPRVVSRSSSGRAGILKSYEAGLSAVLRDQAVPLTVFFFGLSQIIKPFARAAGFNAENIVLELVGESTKFKSALTCGLAASAWGSADPRDGYSLTWNITKQKIEELFTNYDHQLLILDEVTLAGENPKERGEAVGKVVHRLSSGVGRGVTGKTATGHSLNMLSTSNEPLRSILPASQDVHAALGVRLISFEVPSRETFYFDRIPEGFASVGEAMDAAFGVVQQHHGLLARHLIQRVLVQVNDRYEHFLGHISKAVRKFMKRIGLGNADMATLPYRRAQPFALTYATAVIAFKTGTLKKKLWGGILKTILRAWNEHASAGAGDDGDARFNSYMNDSSNLFVDGRGKEKPVIRNTVFAGMAGIFYLSKDKELLLAVPTAAASKLGYPKAVLKQLKKDGILKAGTKTLQRKLFLRRVGKAESRDTFYVFKIAGISSQVRFWEGE
ncbi:hypothetical protein ASG19_04355 [Rhizobium sp. Leaf306]|uniref:DUF927 domain-containing protein n=1 Tax=Rhizobium sp. Leaf306 TaxID=1736330 RepID=UPI000713D980|nr:DUF927 domain-containing protein [Rhizobium sp. Leaf306]KQQ38294.1 hypothetical protein ASG19_04355 [Rhizobium sp. Leaf306]